MISVALVKLTLDIAQASKASDKTALDVANPDQDQVGLVNLSSVTTKVTSHILA